MLWFLVYAMQNGRVITYQANPHVCGFSDVNFFALMRGFKWSKFQSYTCPGCEVIYYSSVCCVVLCLILPVASLAGLVKKRHQHSN